MKWAALLGDLDESKERERLRGRIQRLLDKWQPILGVTLRDWDLRKMKTYWGSSAGRRGTSRSTPSWRSCRRATSSTSWSTSCVHQLTDGHDARFYKLMDEHLPGWRRMQARIRSRCTGTARSCGDFPVCATLGPMANERGSFYKHGCLSPAEETGQWTRNR